MRTAGDGSGAGDLADLATLDLTPPWDWMTVGDALQRWAGVRLESWIRQTRAEGAPPYLTGSLDGETDDDLSAADRTYVAQMVSAQTGMSTADADKRVADVTNEAKVAVDQARKAAAKLSMWLTASLLIGAFCASLAAIEGGQLRDGAWRGVIGGRKLRTIQTR